MIQELIYTSVPQGLKPGTQGFCTVACTAGMPTNLVMRLESLSGYRPVFSTHDPNISNNPVVFSHLVLKIGGVPWHVLSRTSDAGLDYTQRANKISHHLVLDSAELQNAGPTSVLSQPDLFQTHWNKKPTLLPTDKTLRNFETSPRFCTNWHQQFGDAGWAAVLAETVQNQRPVSLIFRPGTDLLPLFDEALALLPPEQRWKATFTTYFCHLPAGIDSLWKGILIGSPEMAQAKLSANTLVIDLTQPLPPPPACALLELARNGIRPEPQILSMVTVSKTITSKLEAALGTSDSETYRLKTDAAPVPVPVTAKQIDMPLPKKHQRDALQCGNDHSEKSDIQLPKSRNYFLMAMALITFVVLVMLVVGSLCLVWWGANYSHFLAQNQSSQDVKVDQVEQLDAAQSVVQVGKPDAKRVMLDMLPDYPNDVGVLDYHSGTIETLKNKSISIENYLKKQDVVAKPFYFFAHEPGKQMPLFAQGNVEYFGDEKNRCGQMVCIGSKPVCYALSDEFALHLISHRENQPHEPQSDQSFFFSEIKVGDHYFSLFPAVRKQAVSRKISDFTPTKMVLLDYNETVLDELKKMSNADGLAAEIKIATNQTDKCDVSVGEAKHIEHGIVWPCQLSIKNSNELLLAFDVEWDYRESKILLVPAQESESEKTRSNKDGYQTIELTFDFNLFLNHPDENVSRRIQLLTTAIDLANIESIP